MVVHVSPPKPFPPQQRCSLSLFVTAVKGNNHCSNTYNFSDFSPCCSTAILPIVVTELTEYNCQSVARFFISIDVHPSTSTVRCVAGSTSTKCAAALVQSISGGKPPNASGRPQSFAPVRRECIAASAFSEVRQGQIGALGFHPKRTTRINKVLWK